MYKFAVAIGLCTLFIVGLIILVNHRPFSTQQSSTVQGESTQAIGRWRNGPENAAIKIIEFADFECPACAAAAPAVKQIIEKYPDKVSISFVHFPLPQHKRAIAAANVAEAAGEEGKFWEMFEILYRRQIEWTTAKDPKKFFVEYSNQLNINPAVIAQAYETNQYTGDRIDRDYLAGLKLGINSTPTYLINGQRYTGVLRLEQWEKIINNLSEVDGQ